MADKKELVHLHQLLAQVQQFLIHEEELPADTENLAHYNPGLHLEDGTGNNVETYADIGVNALDINVCTQEKKDAVMTLARELGNMLNFQLETTETPPLANPNQTQAKATQSHELDTGETKTVTLAEYGAVDTRPSSQSQNDKNTPAAGDFDRQENRPVTETTAEATLSKFGCSSVEDDNESTSSTGENKRVLTDTSQDTDTKSSKQTDLADIFAQ